MEVGNILIQDANELKRPLIHQIETRSEPFVDPTELGCGQWTYDRQKKTNVFNFVFKVDVKVAENIQTWQDIKFYASKINVVGQPKKALQAQKYLESRTRFIGER